MASKLRVLRMLRVLRVLRMLHMLRMLCMQWLLLPWPEYSRRT